MLLVRRGRVKSVAHRGKNESGERLNAKGTAVELRREKILIELTTSDHELTASREGSERRNYGTYNTWRYTMCNSRSHEVRVDLI